MANEFIIKNGFISQGNSTVTNDLAINGNVGIGTLSPSEKLEVSGKTKTVNFQMTSGATSGYVLSSDSLGNATWIPGSGISGVTDTFVTGGTYSNGSLTLNRQNGSVTVTGFLTGVTTSFNNTVYVATNGSDSTGTRNDLTKPFLTLEAAVAVASSGDTIIVYPGTYTVTTTATNGIAKSGVNYYFYPGTTVNKSTAGSIFYDTTFSLPCNVYGYGTFNKTTSAGYIYYNTKLNSVFEATNVTSSISHCFVTDVGEVSFNVNYATSTAGAVLFMNQSNGSVGNRIKVDCVYWKSTANSVITGGWWYYTKLFVNGNRLESTTSTTIAAYNTGNYLEINVDEIIGLTYGLTSGDGTSGVINVNCTYISGVYDGGKEYNIFGHCGTLNSTGGLYNVLRAQTITVSGGYVKTTQNMFDAAAGLVTVSGGILDIDFGFMSYGIIFNCTGGIMNIRSAVVANQISTSQGRVINGGEVNVYSKFIHGGGADYTSYNMFTLQAGTLRLLAPVQNNFNTSYANISSHGVVWSGGKLIVDRCAINIADTLSFPIQATTAGLNLKVLSGGLSTNVAASGGTLPGKKLKYKFSITAVASTGLYVLVPTSILISESNTGVYNTKALLAQRMVALINANATLNVAVIATQDTPGTDEYFYIETLTAGPVFTFNSLTNMTSLVQRWNSYAITNITGGSILENSNVE